MFWIFFSSSLFLLISGGGFTGVSCRYVDLDWGLFICICRDMMVLLSELLSHSDTVLPTAPHVPAPKPFSLPVHAVEIITSNDIHAFFRFYIKKNVPTFSPSHDFFLPSPGSAPNRIPQNPQRSTSASCSSPSKRPSRQPSASSNTTPGPSSPLPRDRSWAACTSLTSFLVSRSLPFCPRILSYLGHLERGNVGG